jgi:hypothetical protein
MLSSFKKSNLMVGLSGLVVAFILMFFFKNFSEFLFYIAENYFSDDKNILPENIIYFEVIAGFSIGIIFIFSFLFFIDFYSKSFNFLNRFLDFDKAGIYFFTDKISPSKTFPKYAFFIGSISALILHFMFLVFGEPAHEGIIEESSSFLFLFAGLLFFASTFYLKKKFFTKSQYLSKLFTLLFLGTILLIIFGEEISWGQRVLEIESSEIFMQYNFQQEINVHNFFNPVFKFIYPVVGISSFVILFFLWSFYKQERSIYYHLFVPHKSLFFLIFFMACASFQGDSETYEEMLTVFFLLYSLRILVIFKGFSIMFDSKIKNKKLTHDLVD